MEQSKWNSFWKADKDSKYTFRHIVDILIHKNGWTELPCYVGLNGKKKYEYKVPEQR